MIFARVIRRINLAVRSWADVAMEKAQGHIRDLAATDEQKRMILVLPVDSSVCQLETRLTTVLNLLDEGCYYHGGSGEVYAPRHEATSALAKVPDVGALDAMTKDAPFNYAYRTTTCFGHGKCHLADQETTIFKGTFSCAALHVRELAQTDREAGKLVRCTKGAEMLTYPLHTETPGDDELPLPLPRRDSLRQENVGTLQSWGEVRALMAGNKVDEENTVFTSLCDKSSLIDSLV